LQKSVSSGFGPAQRYLATDFSGVDIWSDEDAWLSRRSLLASATNWFEERAQAGNTEAQFELGDMHWKNEATRPSRAKAYAWMKAAATQNHRQACTRLGYWYLRDDHSDYGTEQAIYWLSKAVDLGDSWSCYKLGNLYLFGHGGSEFDVESGKAPHQRFQPDTEKARFWYERHFKMGSSSGAYMLGKLYLLGKYVKQNLKLAEEWLLIAAKTPGGTDAERLLGLEYASGQRFKHDLQSAIRWLSPSAERGLPDIQYELGIVYEEIEKAKLGLRDYAYAYKWYDIASTAKGKMPDFVGRKAAAARDSVINQMTREQLAEARRLVEEWTHAHAP
jgi:TPR repeat protein